MASSKTNFMDYFQSNSDEDGASIRDVFSTLWRGKMIIIASCVIITTLATLVIKQIQPLYTTNASVMIESRKLQVVNVQDVLSGMALDAAVVMTELEVIRSPALVGRVVDNLGLHLLPVFTASDKEQKSNGLIHKIKNFTGSLIGIDSSTSSATKPILTEQGKRGRAINKIIAGLDVKPKGRSLVIDIGYTISDPVIAALVANSVADQYLNDQLNAKIQASNRANSWLTSRIEKLEQQLRDSEKAVERYRAQKDLISGSGNRVNSQQLTEINSQIVVAQTKRAEAEVRYNMVKSISAETNAVGATVEVLASPTIQNLKSEESKLFQLKSQLETKYGSRHPKILDVNAGLENIQTRIVREVAHVVQGISNEYRVAVARERALLNTANKLKSQVAVQNNADVKFRELQREAKANRELYESFLSRLKETSDQEGIQTPDAVILSKAGIPSIPSFPKTNLTILLAALGSAFFGGLLVFLREKLDNHFRSADEIEKITGVRSLGAIPLDKMVNQEIDLKNVVTLDDSLFTESIRSLHANLCPSDANDKTKVFAVSSTLPSEGKTLTSVSLARIAAQSGQKTIVIDCDLRRPQIHVTAKTTNKMNVVDVLTGKTKLEDAIIIDDQSNMDILTSKVFHGNPLDLLRSNRMRKLVELCRQNYDLVILDTPSVLAVADAKIVAKLADELVYAVKWNDIPRESVLSGIKQFMEFGIEFSGCVMTQVDLKKHAKYGYHDSTYYYGQYGTNYIASA